MDSEQRRRFLRRVAPWLGALAAVVALTLGIRALAAGAAGSGLAGYGSGVLELGAGYVTARRAWSGTLDAVFVGGVVAVAVLSAFVLTQLHLPPSVFQQVTGG